MTTNGENPLEDAEMAECDGEQIVTMVDVLKEQQDFEDDANAVLGGSDEKECTYSQGYIKRQAIYACVTCCPDAKDDVAKRAGFCLACSLTCHESHDVMELYTKRNFRCDCGNPKFPKPCQFNPIKADLNNDNIYNQNFIGLYCSCQKPYGDLESALDDDMIQCIMCEDWWHASHLDAVVPPNDQYSEMICKLCMAKNEFLHDYSDLVINAENGEIDVVKVDGENHGIVDEKLNGDITISNGVEPEVSATENINEVDSTTLLIKTAPAHKENEASSNTEKNTEDHEDSGEDDANKSPDVPMETDTITEPVKSEKNNVDSEIPVENAEIDASTDKVVGGSTEEVNPNTSVTDNEEMEQESKDSDKKDETQASGDIQNYITEEKSPENVQQISNESQVQKDDKNNLTNQTDSELNNTEHISSDEKIEDKSEVSNITEHKIKKVDDSNESANAEKELNPKTNDSNATTNVENTTNAEETSQDIEINDKDTANSETDKEDDNTSILAENSTNNTVSEVTSTEENTVPKVASAEENIVSEVASAENKRKLSTEDLQDDVTTKKPKTDDKPCVRPKGVRKMYKGATFWPCTFRQKLCTCNECITMYKDLNVLFLIDSEDTVMEYEKLGKEKTAGKPNQYEKGMEALSSLGRVQQIDALTEYNKMRDKLLNFLQNFKDRKEIVTENDIKSFFAGMKPKKRTDGVYFCG